MYSSLTRYLYKLWTSGLIIVLIKQWASCYTWCVSWCPPWQQMQQSLHLSLNCHERNHFIVTRINMKAVQVFRILQMLSGRSRAQRHEVGAWHSHSLLINRLWAYYGKPELPIPMQCVICTKVYWSNWTWAPHSISIQVTNATMKLATYSQPATTMVSFINSVWVTLNGSTLFNLGHT